MPDWFKKALTRKRHRQGARGKPEVIVIEPDERLVYLVKFAVLMTLCLTALEIAHMAFMRVWNAEVFAAVTGLIGTVTGILIGKKA
jgi:hypothetical protein